MNEPTKIMQVNELDKLCKFPGCYERATWYPSIRIWAIGMKSMVKHRSESHLIEIKRMGHCDHCRNKTNVESILTDAGWRIIEGMREREKQPRLKRESARLEWVKYPEVLAPTAALVRSVNLN